MSDPNDNEIPPELAAWGREAEREAERKIAEPVRDSEGFGALAETLTAEAWPDGPPVPVMLASRQLALLRALLAFPDPGFIPAGPALDLFAAMAAEIIAAERGAPVTAEGEPEPEQVRRLREAGSASIRAEVTRIIRGRIGDWAPRKPEHDYD